MGGLTNTDAPLPAAQPTWRGSLVSGRSLRYAAGVLLIAVGYYTAAKGGLALLLTGPAGAFWPATGVGIAVLYLGGLRWWPGVLLGDLLTREFALPLLGRARRNGRQHGQGAPGRGHPPAAGRPAGGDGPARAGRRRVRRRGRR